MGLAHKPFVLLVGDHHNAILALPRDELWPLGAGATKKLAKARLGHLELPLALTHRFLTLSAISLVSAYNISRPVRLV